MPPAKPEDVGILDAIAFFVELAMVILLIFAGHGLASGWQGWALGAFLAFVAVGIWAQWMAPTSDKRLEQPDPVHRAGDDVRNRRSVRRRRGPDVVGHRVRGRSRSPCSARSHALIH